MRKQFWASLARARFYTSWVKNGSVRARAARPFYPQEQTTLACPGMSVWCQCTTADSCTAAISTAFDHLLGAREQRCLHFEGPSTYVASIRRRVQPLRRMLAQLREFAILRAEETRCYELRGARPAAW